MGVVVDSILGRASPASGLSFGPMPQRGIAYQPRVKPWEHVVKSVRSEGTPHKSHAGRPSRDMRRSFRRQYIGSSISRVAIHRVPISQPLKRGWGALRIGPSMTGNPLPAPSQGSGLGPLSRHEADRCHPRSICLHAVSGQAAAPHRRDPSHSTGGRAVPIVPRPVRGHRGHG